jgi:outer membrane protein assembly factor BamD
MRLLPLLLAAALLACGSKRVSLGGEMRYAKSAEENYTGGQEEMKKGNDAEATKLFEHVRTKYPFSRYAALSELRLADLKFKQGRYLEAAEAYKEFVKLHPTHEELDYASFRVGLSTWREAPSSFWMFPPSHEKDQQTVRDTVDALAGFAERFPTSKHRPEAEKILEQARGRLAEHEWYVAEFYAKRRHWAGAANRLEALVTRFPGTRREADALFRLAEMYVELDERFRAQQALQQLLVKHPQSPRRGDAEKLLARLR